MAEEDIQEDIEMVEDDVEMDDDVDDEEVPERERKAYIPGISRALKEDEELEFDPAAYKLFHSFNTSWPCLSFDVVADGLGDNRSTFPHECYIVSGTQADNAKSNKIVVMGIKNLNGLHKEKENEDDSDESESDDSDDEDDSSPVKKAKQPKLHAQAISHFGGINRVRADRLGDSTVTAIWNDKGRVQLWNITAHLNACHAMTGDSNTVKVEDKPLFSFDGSGKEGFGLAWSRMKKGDLASGDVGRNLYIWHMREGGVWAVDQKPLHGHTGQVEDIAWSPNEEGLLSSCSSDGTIRLWDTRVSGPQACVCTVQKAHDSDVNVISWNPQDSLLLSGGDDGELKIWSLKTIQFGQPVARFKHHTGPITSVEWHPQDSTTFMASGEDDQTSIWDIATESDGGETIEGIPPQLMFLHLGQKEIKEVHWHPQIPGLAINTALDGFNVFKTINI